MFSVDIIECPRCGGRLRVVEVVSEPADIGRELLAGLWRRAGRYLRARLGVARRAPVAKASPGA